MTEVPKLNASGWEPRLEHFLTSLRNEIISLKKMTGVDPTGPGGGGADEEAAPFDIVYEATASILAGTGETESTENAWTTVPSGAPAGARFAIIQFHMWSANNNAGGLLSWRTSSGLQEVVAAVVRYNGASDADRESLPWYFVPLTDSGDFDYKADETNGAVEWKVRRLGYVQ